MQIIRDIKAIPVLRPAIALAIGIIVTKWIGVTLVCLFFIMILSLILLLFILFFRIDIKPSHSWIPGLLIFMMFFCCGIMINKISLNNQNVIPENSDEYWLGEVLSSPVIKNKQIRFDLSLFDDSCLTVRYKTQVMMQTGSGILLPQPGQIIFVKTNPERIQGPANPGEFDYAAYLESKGFLYRCFIKDGEWGLISSRKQYSLRLLTLRLKNLLWNKIESLEPQNQNLGVLYALGLGSKELLTPEIREAYASSGAMHVLAVSGLHVGLIWMVLGYIFIWLKELPGGKLLQFIVISILIWFYAIMTGATPSVVRSAGMFTLVSLGKIIQKETSVYNSLAVSAFFGLLFNPQWLSDAGFQLSYTAVISIVFFQPRISAIFAPPTWFMKKIWDISSVSIAAQIGTLPLTLYYFNRFPPWFIISNLVVIPLVTVIMMTFILLLLFIVVPVFFSLILKVLLFQIGLMNKSVSYIEGLPGPPMDQIYLNEIQMFCLVILLMGISFFIRYRNSFFFIIGLTSLLFLFSIGTFQKYYSNKQSEMILFSVPGRMILGIIDGSNGIFLHNYPDTIDIKQSFNYKCKPFLLKNGITNPCLIGLWDTLNIPPEIQQIPGNDNFLFRTEDKSVVILNDPMFFKGNRSDITLHSDILILNSRIPEIWKDETFLFRTNMLVISTAVSRYLRFPSNEKSIIQSDTIIDTRLSGAFRWPLIYD